MTKGEFDEVLKGLNVYNPLYNDKDKKEVHEWNGLRILYIENKFAFVEGKVPLEVANILNQKQYQKYGIRINGITDPIDPRILAVDERYEKYLEKLYNQGLSVNQVIKRAKMAKKELDRRDDSLKYITCYYHIDTKEGLMTFLVEMMSHMEEKKEKAAQYFKKEN